MSSTEDEEREALALPRRIALRRGDGPTVRDAALERMTTALEEQVVARWVPVLQRLGTRDARWRWAEKTTESELCYMTGVEHVAITHEGEVQGVMITSLPDRPPVLSSLPDLLYVEYVAVAPWNRANEGQLRKFKAVGPILLQHAVRRSRHEGRRGRVGLHSELDPDTLKFYREKVLIPGRGADHNEDNREYFEGDVAWASAFLAGR